MAKVVRLLKSKNIIVYLLSFSASLVGIGLNFFLARVLGSENYGRIQFLVALATTCSQILIFGLNFFLIREARNKKHNGEVVNKCFSLFLTIVLFFVPIVYYVLNNHINETQNNLLMIISVIAVSILMGFSALVSSYYQGNGKYHFSLIIDSLLPKLIMLLTAIAFLSLGKMSQFQDKYLLIYIIVYGAITIPFVFKLIKRFNLSFEFSEIKSICFFFGVTITYSLGNNLTKVLQGTLFHNDVALGIVSVSISIVSLVTVFTSVLDNLVKPIFAKKSRENDKDGLLDSYRFVTRTNMYVALPLYLFFIIHPSRFLGIFGSTYLEYPMILSFIAMANAVNNITGPNGTMLAMTGKEKFELFNGFIYFGVYFVAIFAFSFASIYGLSIALLVSQVVVNIAKYSETWYFFKKNPLNKKTLLSIAIVFAFDFAAIWALKYIPLGLIYWLLIGGAVGVGIVLMNTFVVSLYGRNDFKTLLKLKL